MKMLKKSLALLLTIVMLVSAVPLSSFSAEKKKTEELSTADMQTEVENLEIIGEVEDKRDEFTKVYELEDGSFYEVKSASPIHVMKKGDWVEASEISQPQTVNKVGKQMERLVDATSTRSAGESADLSNTDTCFNGIFMDVSLDEFTYDDIDLLLDDPDLEEITKISADCLLGVKDDNDRTQGNNQVTISYQYQLGLSVEESGNIYLYENNKDITDDDLWGFDNFYYIRNDSNQAHLLDIVAISADGYYSFDATDLYNRWKKSLSDDYGVAFESTGDCSASVTGFFATRRYRVTNPFNSTSTYHTVDMGRAGTVYIDDFTNIPVLKREEVALSGNLAPIQINRCFDYGKASGYSELYGAFGTINYEARLSRAFVDSSKSIYYWNAVNGQTVRFVVSSNSTTATDADGLGYTITDISGESYGSATITTPDNSTAEFNSAGQMKKLTDSYGDAITISYTSGRISYIQDGNARRYYFTYSSPTYTYNNGSFSMRTLKSITIKYRVGVTYRTLVVDGNNMIFEFEYVATGSNRVGLSSVTYPDGEEVEYAYNNDGLLYQVINNDGKRLTLNYSTNVVEYSCQEPGENDNPQLYEIDSTSSQASQPPFVGSYLVEVLNTDDDPDDPDYQEYLTVSSLTIDRHNSYQRKFVDHNNKTEIIQYDFELRPTTYQKDNGAIYSYHYSADGLSDSVTRFSGFTSTDNLLADSSFDALTNWEESDDDVLSAAAVSINSGSSENVLRINGIETSDCYAYQVIDASDITANTIIAVEGKGIANFPVASSNNFYGIEVYSCTNAAGDNEQLLYQLPFDNTIYYEQQHKIGAFVLSQTTSYIKVKLMFSHQENWALLDDVMLYADDGTHVVTEAVTNLQDNPFIDSRDTVTYNDKGLVETIERTDGVDTTIKQFGYDNNYFLSNSVINNITTNYVYDSKTGKLMTKADSYGSTAYEYSPMGLLKKVSAAVSGLTEQSETINAEYTYQGDRIATIANEGQTYSINYNSFGKIKGVSVKENGTTSDTNLVNYSYVGSSEKLNQIQYANGNSIQYSYSQGKIDEISFASGQGSPEIAYKYFYNNGGALEKVVDTQSGLVINYSSTGYNIMKRDGTTYNGDSNNILYSVNYQSGGGKSGELFGIDYQEVTGETTSPDGYTVSQNSEEELTFTTSGENTYSDSFEGSSTIDYFDRQKNTSFESASEDTEGIIVGGEEITYDETTNYIDYQLQNNNNNSYSSNFPSDNQVEISSSNFPNSRNFASYYEYDAAGRIKKIYYSTATSQIAIPANKTLAYYYEYDEIGQVTLCVDVLKQVLTTINYDDCGNIASKHFYTGNEFSFNATTCEYTLNAAGTEKLFSYNELGRLTVFNGHSINYDGAGNPLDYYDCGMSSSSETHYKLKWNIDKIETADKVSGTVAGHPNIADVIERFRYTYNPDGKLTKRTVSQVRTSVTVENNEDTPQYEETFKNSYEYIWEKDKLIGYKYTFVVENQNYTVDCKYIYSGDEVLGIVTHSDVNSFNLIEDEMIYDNTEILLNNVFWFIRDANGNIVSVFTPRNDFSLDLYRDNNGVYSGIGSSGVMIDDIRTYIENNNNGYYDLLTSLAVAFAQGDTLKLSPIEFKDFMVDVDTGLCYRDGRYYSPTFGRYINYGDLRDMQKNSSQLLTPNVYSFCNNDTLNNVVSKDFAVKPFVEKTYEVSVANEWYRYFKQHG